MLVNATSKVLSHMREHFRLENVVNLMLYASWAIRHVAFQQPDFANYPELVALQKTIVSEKKCFFFLNCKIITGHEIIDF